MDDFEKLLDIERVSVERFVRFRLNFKEDADDVLQEVYFTAYQKFAQLKNKTSFKAWIIRIARNQCNDYFRKKAAQFAIPIDELIEKELSDGRYGVTGIVYELGVAWWVCRISRFFISTSGKSCRKGKLQSG